MIILTISITLPSWNLVSGDIADTVIKYLVGIESGSVRIFAEIIKFDRTIDNLHFEKILLLIVTHLAEVDACIFVITFLIYILHIKNSEKHFNVMIIIIVNDKMETDANYT